MSKTNTISEFINKVVSGDTEAAKALFSTYCNDKAKSTLASASVPLSEGEEMFAQFKTELSERFDNAGSSAAAAPIRMDGNNIMVNNKSVGKVSVDMDDFESGINFTSSDGAFSKEFETAEALFDYLATQYVGTK